MGVFVQRDVNSDTHNMETVTGDAGGEIAKVSLKTAVETAISSAASTLSAIAGYLDGVEGFVDGVEGLITATNSALSTLQGYVDGVESKLDTLHTDLGTTLAGYLSTLAAAVTSNRVQTDVVTLPAPNSSGPYYTQSTVGTSATVLTSQALKHGLWVRNLDSTKNLAVGNDSSVTTSNGYVLRPGEEKFLPVANRSQVYVVGSASSTSYCTVGT